MDRDGTWHRDGPWSRPHWDSASLSKKGQRPTQFLVPFYCGQTARCMKMPLGMEVGLSPGDFVLDGYPALIPIKGRSPTIFGPCLLWPNGWMDQDATWYGGRSRCRRHCVRWGPSYPPPAKKAQPPSIRPLYIVAEQMHVSGYHLVRR